MCCARRPPKLKARDLMVGVRSVTPKTTLTDAVGLMVRAHQPMAPLLDDHDRRLGYIRLFEVLAHFFFSVLKRVRGNELVATQPRARGPGTTRNNGGVTSVVATTTITVAPNTVWEIAPDCMASVATTSATSRRERSSPPQR